MKLIVYQLKCYSPTSIISPALLVLRSKLVLPVKAKNTFGSVGIPPTHAKK